MMTRCDVHDGWLPTTAHKWLTLKRQAVRLTELHDYCQRLGSLLAWDVGACAHEHDDALPSRGILQPIRAPAAGQTMGANLHI